MNKTPHHAAEPADVPDPAGLWTEFCQLLVKAGAVLQRDDLDLDDFDRAEGVRYLGRLAQNGLSAFMENPGPLHPAFRSLPEHCGFGLDNPDNVYSSAGIDPNRDYVIRGSRGTITYLSFAAQNMNFAKRDTITGGAGHLYHGDLRTEADGSFTVTASQQPQPGNWLQLNPDTTMILMRQTFADRRVERAAEVTIECVGVDERPAQLPPASVKHRILGAAMYTIGSAAWFADWVVPWMSNPNQMHVPTEDHHRLMGGDPNIAFQLGYWTLQPGQRLIVDAVPPRCDYWNFQLGNIWAECLDKRRQISRNSASTTPNPDGSITLVISADDPGHPNWIDTCGHRHGIMGMRWVAADSHPQATLRVEA
ncbi:MAG TPA: DUF1214 domain-containing protein [Ilumatobacteraceae bacterium]|nr:DUF1214 domain-containing protein [Ilumatobacteraceae bacterium]